MASRRSRGTMQLNLSHIQYTYPAAAEPALRGITATFPTGWIGIVGDNGGGKTTLALVASGVLQPDAGTVSPQLVCRYCTQDATRPPDNLDDFALAYDGVAVRLRRGLDIDDDWPWRYGTLSGGQQKRLQVACALWAQPDVLVVDEPTNHVDAATRTAIAATRTAIAAALAEFAGVGLLISHDRQLLDQLCSQCLFVADGTATMRPGGYTAAAGQATLERDSAVHAREALRREKARLQREAQRRREEASRADGKRSLRGVDKHDGDARHQQRVAVVSGKDGQAGRLSARMEGRLQDAQAQLDAVRVQKRYESDVWFDASPSRRKVLLRMEPQVFALGDLLLQLPALHLGNTDHVGLTGDNGCGKTTLVKHMIGLLGGAGGGAAGGGVRTLYIPQEPDQVQRRAALTALRELSSERMGRVALGSCAAQFRARAHSGGRRHQSWRDAQADAGAGHPWPARTDCDGRATNHLDPGSTEALERMLAAYPGACCGMRPRGSASYARRLTRGSSSRSRQSCRPSRSTRTWGTRRARA